MKKIITLLILTIVNISFAEILITDPLSQCTSWSDGLEAIAQKVKDGKDDPDNPENTLLCGCHKLKIDKTDYNYLNETLEPAERDRILRTYNFDNIQAITKQLKQNCINVEITLEDPTKVCNYTSSLISPLSKEKFMSIDTNNSCSIDTNSEKCNFQLNKELIDSPTATKRKITGQNYGCYGNLDTPKNLFEGMQELQLENTIDVFSDQEGLVASSGQKNVLKNILQTDQGGPIVGFINFIINYLVSIVFVLCMASLIYGGYNLIFAGLDSEMIEKGKNAIKYAIFGFAFIMLSYTIVIIVQSLF